MLPILVLVLLSACKIELDVATTVDEDGSGRLAVTVVLSETVRGALSEGGLITDDPDELRRIIAEEGPKGLNAPDLPDPVDILEERVPRGWRSDRVEDGALRGLRLSARFASLDEIPELLERLDDWGHEIVDRHGGDIERVGVRALVRGFSLTSEGPVFRFRAEPTAEAYAGATGGPNNLRADLSISVTLPGGIVEHDADERAGNTLTWVIPPGEARTASATSDLTHQERGIPVVPIAVVGSAASIAGLLGWRVRRGRRLTGRATPEGPS